jgi:hypothetical protein
MGPSQMVGHNLGYAHIERMIILIFFTRLEHLMVIFSWAT